jgi:hypothetical protein
MTMATASRSSACTTVAALAALAGAWPASAQPNGDEWEYAMTVEMAGMKMPLPPTMVCARPDEGNTPPVDKHCQLKDRKVSGSSTTFHIVCGPPEPGEMKGQFTRKGDRLEGRYTLKNADGEMIVVTTGRKLGACDPTKPALPPVGRK